MSVVHSPRPYDARTRSFSRGCTTRSWTATLGMLLFIFTQRSPPSMVTNTPSSLPTKSRSGLTPSSHTTLMGSSGRLAVMGVQLRP